MPTRSARSTPAQRADLIVLETMLRSALDALDGRFWATRSQKESYETVLRHLAAWIDWEHQDDD